MAVYCYDTEFLEDGRTVDLISIGIACPDGREYYAVSSDMPVDRIKQHEWLMVNVWPSLPLSDGELDMTSDLIKPRAVIADEVREFLLSSGSPELWADYAAYDHVVLCQLWGPMIQLPDGLPMWTHDIEHLIEVSPGFVKPTQKTGEHNALEDARHNLHVLNCLRTRTASSAPPPQPHYNYH